MANASAIALPRVPSDFEDMIERIENLRLGRSRQANQSFVSIGSEAARFADREGPTDRWTKLNELDSLANGQESTGIDDSNGDGNDAESANDDTDNDENCTDCLIERGPMKSQLHPREFRGQPYCTIDRPSIQPSKQFLETDGMFPLGYEGSTEIGEENIGVSISRLD